MSRPDPDHYSMRLKDYAKNHKKRKYYIQQLGLLMVGVDVIKVKHSAYLGTQAGVMCRKLGFTNTCNGFNGNILEQFRIE